MVQRTVDMRVPPEILDHLTTVHIRFREYLLSFRTFSKINCQKSDRFIHRLAECLCCRVCATVRFRSISVTVGIRGVEFRPGWSRAAVAIAMHWTKHIGAARDLENKYSSSGIVKRVRASFASGDNWLSVMATMEVPLVTATSDMTMTSLA
jgi:hypothetical protein